MHKHACISVRVEACVRACVRAFVRACVCACVRACVRTCARACERARVRALNVNVLAFRNFENKTSWISLNLSKTDNHISGAVRKERVMLVFDLK